MDRKNIAINGSIIGIINQIVNLVFKLTVRTLLIRLLGKEILGLDGVLIDTVNMLSLAELGVTSAMTFRLYSPLISHDNARVNELMAAYKAIYRVIALAVGIIGSIISFFLPAIIKDVSISWQMVYLAYFLQVTNSVCSYLLSYRRILLDADQKRNFCMIVDMVATIIFSVFKIICLLLWKSYILYIVCSIIQTIGSNIYLHVYTNKTYQELKEKKVKKSDIKLIMGETKDVLGGKLAGFAYSSTDNIVISAFIGTGVVGLLSNYKFISTSLKSVMTSMMSTMQPLIGHYLNSDTSKEQALRTLNRYIFVRYILVGFTSIVFIAVGDSFVSFWSGNEDYVMQYSICVLLAAEYYIGGVYGPFGEYLIGMGMFKYSKYPQIAGAIGNIVLSIIGALLYGVDGVLLATVVSQLMIFGGYFYLLFKYFFIDHTKSERKLFLFNQVKYTANVVLIIIIVRVILSVIHMTNNIANCILGTVISIAAFSVSLVLIFKKTDEFQYGINLLKRLVNKGRQRTL